VTCAQAVVAVLVIGIAQAVPSTAQAQAENDGWLEWATTDASGSCIDARGFANQVARALGRSPLAAARDARMTIVARVERSSPTEQPPRWSGEIRVRDDQGRWVGSRTIARAGLSCRPLGDALALATALVLAGETVAQDTPLPEAGPSEPATTTAPTVSPPPESPRMEGPPANRPPELGARAQAAPPVTSPRTWSVGIEGGLATAVGLLPEPSLGGTVAVFLHFGAGWKVFATGGTWSRQVVSTGAEQGVTLNLASLGAGICPLDLPWHGFNGRICARVDGGRLRATGFGFAQSTVQDSFTADAAGAFEVRRPLVGPVYASFSLALVVPFIRDRISYEDRLRAVHPIFRPSPVGGTGELRLGASF